MHYNTFEGYIRPHMDEMQRQAARQRLIASVIVPPGVRLGRLLIRTGERLLRASGQTATITITKNRKAIS